MVLDNNIKVKNFTFRVVKNGEVISRCQTSKKRRFINHLRTINWKNKPLKVYLRVYCGRQKDVWGNLSGFYNDG